MVFKNILFIHHSPSTNTKELSKFVEDKINSLTLKVNLKSLTPLAANFKSFESIDGLIIGTTENFGYMSGLTKDFFDRNYELLRTNTQGLPVFYYIRAGLDGEGSQVAIDKILVGLGWRQVLPPLILKGPWEKIFFSSLEEKVLNFTSGIELGIY
ncbi:MAG: hypothetical protein ISQ39_02890 [Alphaproteobacteria bacterium]|jgi:hypothetical protein|nr:hypothetical protein [Alphaproteobacteria bacterium]